MFDAKVFSAALVKDLLADGKLGACKAYKPISKALVMWSVSRKVEGSQDVAHVNKLDDVVFGAAQVNKSSSHPDGDEAVLSEGYASVLGVA